jgi:hypothetical protein
MFWNRKSVSEWAGDNTYLDRSNHQSAAPTPKKYYSVGLTEDDQIALTLYGPHGMSTSATMNVAGCKQLMHMLQSAIDVVNANIDTVEPTKKVDKKS